MIPKTITCPSCNGRGTFLDTEGKSGCPRCQGKNIVKNIASAKLSASLFISCPQCDQYFNLFDDDDAAIYLIQIFNNKWDQLKGEEATCPECDHEFTISEVEW